MASAPSPPSSVETSSSQHHHQLYDEGQGWYRVTWLGGLRVRSEPSTNSTVVAQLNVNHTILALELRIDPDHKLTWCRFV
jgi:hypothetical protein